MSQADFQRPGDSVAEPGRGEFDHVRNIVTGDVPGVVVQARDIGNLHVNQQAAWLSEADLRVLLDVIDERRQASATPATLERRTLSRTVRQSRRSPCVGRGRELGSLRARLAAGQHVVLCGPAGIGKTSLLDHAVDQGVLSADTVPNCDGVMRLSARGMDVEDVLHEVVLECYTVETLAALPVRRLLAPVRALVVLDDVAWSADQVRALFDTMPASVFVIASRQVEYALLLKPFLLGGLSLADSLELMDNELEEPLSAEEARQVERIWNGCHGNPGTLVQLAARLQWASTHGSVTPNLDDEQRLSVPRQVSWAGKQAAAALRPLLAFPDLSCGEDLIRGVGDEDLSGVRNLVKADLAVCELDRYRASQRARDVLSPPVGGELRKLIDRITTWVATQEHPGLIVAELGVIESAVRRLLQQRRYQAALVLARVVSVQLLPSLWWNRGDRVLMLGLRAAREEGSSTDERYFAYTLIARRAVDHKTEEALELLIALIGSARDHDDQQLADRARELRTQLMDNRAELSGPGMLGQVLRGAPEPLGRGLPTLSRLVLQAPVLTKVAGTVTKLAQDHPTEIRNAIAGITVIIGLLFGLPSSSIPPASAHAAPAATPGSPEPPTNKAAPITPVDQPTAAPPPTCPPSPDPTPAAAALTPSAPAPGSPPPTPPAPRTGASTAAPSTGTSADYRYTAAPDLTGTWQLDFIRTNFGGIWMGVPDRYTITLHRLDDSKCGGKSPCYGGQWFHDGHLEGTNFIADAYPAPIGFSATDADADGNQSYSGTIISNDTRQPLGYRGTWTGDGGRTATFSFTHLP